MAANEGATINTLRKIHSAEATYQATTGNGAFGTLDQLGEAQLLNSEMASATHSGYKFTVNVKTAGSEESAGVSASCSASRLRKQRHEIVLY